MTEQIPELSRLWLRRHALTGNDLGALYTLVCDALDPCNPRELRGLNDDKSEYVAQFLHLKVFRKAPAVDEDGHSAPTTAYALCAYFRRYLIDCTRSAAFKSNLSISDDAVSAVVENLSSHDAGAGLDNVLADYGWTELRLRERAQAFISALDEPERLLLVEAFCGEAAGGMSAVASRHRIASYHYRAGKLGLVLKKDKLPKDYGNTAIGQWIEKVLKVEIAAENTEFVRIVFNILCSETSFIETTMENA